MDGNWPPFLRCGVRRRRREFNFNGKQTIKQAQQTVEKKWGWWWWWEKRRRRWASVITTNWQFESPLKYNPLLSFDFHTEASRAHSSYWYLWHLNKNKHTQKVQVESCFVSKFFSCWPYHLTMVSRKSEKNTQRRKKSFIQNLTVFSLFLLELTTNIECRVTLKFNLIKFISRNVLYDWKEAINSPLWRSTSVRVGSYEQRRELSWLFRSGKTWMNVQDTPHIQRTATRFFQFFHSTLFLLLFLHLSFDTHNLRDYSFNSLPSTSPWTWSFLRSALVSNFKRVCFVLNDWCSHSTGRFRLMTVVCAKLSPLAN